MQKTWQQAGEKLYLRDVSNDIYALDNVIYKVEMDNNGALYLVKHSDKFNFDFKIYGLEEDFIRRVIKTYQNTTGNMGVLLNGVKGTGKTVTAEILAMQLMQPIILVSNPYDGLNDLLSGIQQDLTILIDEYEKVYTEASSFRDEDEEGKGSAALLSLMDGTLKTTFRKAFILTTNKLWINENMLNRPGRIRYLKAFADLNREQIEEILDDCLEQKQFKDDIINFLKPLKIITVDIVKSIASEVNIHEESPMDCCKDFNVEKNTDYYNIISKEEIVMEEVPGDFVKNFENKAVKRWGSATLEYGGKFLKLVKKKGEKEKEYLVTDRYALGNVQFKIRIEKVEKFHSIFV